MVASRVVPWTRTCNGWPPDCGQPCGVFWKPNVGDPGFSLLLSSKRACHSCVRSLLGKPARGVSFICTCIPTDPFCLKTGSIGWQQTQNTKQGCSLCWTSLSHPRTAGPMSACAGPTHQGRSETPAEGRPGGMSLGL